MATTEDFSPDAKWGVRNLLTDTWRGCIGTEAVSHRAAREMERAQPLLYRAERNPADVLAAELEGMTGAAIGNRAVQE